MLNLLEYWYAALAEPVGVVLRTDDRDRLRAKLYAARREAVDEKLSSLSIIFSPTAEDEVWIMHNASEKGSGTDNEGNAESILG